MSEDASSRAASSVLATAAAAVASEEALVMRQRVEAAEIAADAAWASVLIDSAGDPEVERSAWLESMRAGTLAVEHNRLAHRSVVAATVAAQTMSRGLGIKEFAASDLMAECIAALVAAKRVADQSHRALIAMAEVNLARVASRDARDGPGAA